MSQYKQGLAVVWLAELIRQHTLRSTFKKPSSKLIRTSMLTCLQKGTPRGKPHGFQ